jgi:Zn finger protein HypA/HybF involved in hydrogenase expression
MITIECTRCDAELALETLVETSVDCPDCRIRVEIAPDADSVVVAIPVAA